MSSHVQLSVGVTANVQNVQAQAEAQTDHTRHVPMLSFGCQHAWPEHACSVRIRLTVSSALASPLIIFCCVIISLHAISASAAHGRLKGV